MRNQLEFIERVRDKSKPALLIAEAADAHYGDMERARSMIVAAKSAGADVIKFQHHIPYEEMLMDIPMSSNMSEPLWDFLVRNALKIEDHVELESFANAIGITYACTPFSLAAALELEEYVNPVFYKIGSGELSDHPTLLKIAEFGKPMIVSTGMSTIEEIQDTYNLLIDKVPLLILLNCTSAYPPGPEDMHLAFVGEMQKLFPKSVVGHSDHFPTTEFTVGSVALGARVVERHFTIDEGLEGPDDDVSLSVESLTLLAAQIKNLSKGMISQKVVHESEREIREWAHRSLVYLKNLPAGHKLEAGDVWGKRPGTGVPSKYLHDYLGKTLKSDVKKDTLLGVEDF